MLLSVKHKKATAPHTLLPQNHFALDITYACGGFGCFDRPSSHLRRPDWLHISLKIVSGTEQPKIQEPIATAPIVKLPLSLPSFFSQSVQLCYGPCPQMYRNRQDCAIWHRTILYDIWPFSTQHRQFVSSRNAQTRITSKPWDAHVQVCITRYMDK